MTQRTVSIIMPVYNAERYLQRSIRSIQAQTYDDWELLIVDDGSSDRSREVVTEFIREDKRVKLLCNQHGGTARARNTALEVMQGEYLTFIDADDAYHPSYLQFLIEAIEKDQSDLSVCGMYEGVDYDGYLKTSLRTDRVCIDRDVALSGMYNGEWAIMISPCNKLFKQKLMSDIRFPDGRCFEDLSVVNRAIFKCRKVSVLNAQLYFYHVTPNSASKTKSSRELLDREWALRSHWEFLFQNGKKDLAYQAIGFYLERLVDTHYRILSSDRPEDCDIIRDYFNRTYRKYWRKIRFSRECAERIFDYRHPTLGTIRYLIRQDGVVKVATRFIKKRLGIKNETDAM